MINELLPDHFYDSFRKSMDYHGINGTKLAELCGVTQPTVANWRNGKVSPQLDQFVQALNNCESMSEGFLADFMEFLIKSVDYPISSPSVSVMFTGFFNSGGVSNG